VQVAHCDAAPLYSLRSPISDIGERLAVHGEGETINKEAAKEQDAPSVDGRSTTEQQETTYCRNNKTIDCHLRALHNACARGDENAQIQIDRHLFLCSVKHGMVIGDFAGMDSALCLHEHHVPQYSLLPDFISVLRGGIFNLGWGGIVYDNLFRYCLPGVRKPRALLATDINNSHNLTAHLNILLATLMGLYPRVSKKPLFSVRVKLFCRVRHLMSASRKEQVDFFCENMSILALAHVEYFVNVLQDFCPVEYNFFLKSCNMHQYCSIAINTTDSFRQLCLQKTDTTSQDWGFLRDTSAVLLDKMVRTFKLRRKPVSILRQQPQSLCARPVNTNKRVRNICHLQVDDYLLDTIVRMHSVNHTNNTFAYMQQHALLFPLEPRLSVERLQVIQTAHEKLMVYKLPWNIMDMQAQAVLRKTTLNPMLTYNICHKSICLRCVVQCNQKAMRTLFTRNDTLRMCLQTHEPQCANCMSTRWVVQLNLLGHVIRIHTWYMYLCPYCCRIHEWGGHGVEFNMNSGELPCKNQNMSSSVDRRKQCAICDRSCTNTALQVLHVPTTSIRNVFLCSKHQLPNHMKRFATNTDRLQDLVNQIRNKPSARK